MTRDRVIAIKQYKPSETMIGINVKEAEASLSRTDAIARIAKSFARFEIGGKTPKAAAELAIDALLGLEE